MFPEFSFLPCFFNVSVSNFWCVTRCFDVPTYQVHKRWPRWQISTPHKHMLIKLDDFLQGSRYNPTKKTSGPTNLWHSLKVLNCHHQIFQRSWSYVHRSIKRKNKHPSVYRIYMSNSEHQYGPPRLLPAPLTQLTLGCNGLRQFVFTLLILNIATCHSGKHVFLFFGDAMTRERHWKGTLSLKRCQVDASS